MFKAGNVNVFYLIMAAWAVLSLQLAYLIASEIWGPESFSALPLVWPLLNSGPILPILWVRKNKTSPVDRRFVLWTVGAGGLGAIVALRYEFIYTSLGLFCWVMLALTNALLLRDSYHKYLPELPKLSASRQTEPTETTVIDHAKYLPMLNLQSILGFPCVMRLRAHFLEALPEVCPQLKENGDIYSDQDVLHELAQMRKFITEKLACQLAYLCAISFFDRTCGPEYRHTKQHRALTNMMLTIESTEQNIRGFPQKKGETLTVVGMDDLKEISFTLDRERQQVNEENGKQAADSDLTIAWVARTVLVHRKFLPEKLDSDTQAKMFEMMRTGMREVGQTFSLMSSEYAVRR